MLRGFTFEADTGWQIIDDDFQDTISHHTGSIYEAVMIVYSARNLPVVPNVIRLFLFMGRTSTTKLAQAIHYSRMNNPLHKLYEAEIDKYLALM